MRINRFQNTVKGARRAFTLPEVMVAGSIGLVITGCIVTLLLDSGIEARLGLGMATVEEKTHVLESQIAMNLRSMSANQGITPDDSTICYSASGAQLGYRGIYAFLTLTNGSTTTEHIAYDPTRGLVTCTPNTASPSQQIVWFTNSSSCVISNLWFNRSLNPDGSLNSSLVNVVIQMSDNGYAQQDPTNNCAYIYRSFSVQLRGD